MNLDGFIERSAIKEFDGGMSRFQAETEAAAEQGFKRFEVLNEIRNGNSQPARNISAPIDRDAKNDLPGMQRGAKEQDRPMPFSNVSG